MEMIGRIIQKIRTRLLQVKRVIFSVYQKIAIRLYITLRPPIQRFKLNFSRSRPWIAGLILIGMLGICLGSMLGGIGTGYYGASSSESDLLARMHDYLRRAGVIEYVNPDNTFFEPAECMFRYSETWHYQASPEQFGYLCGYVKAPLFHDDPGRTTIKIPVAILPAEGSHPREDPLFLAQGGPGGSSLDLYPSLLVNSTLHRNRDIVMVDQRGTRYAQPSLQCEPEDFQLPEDGEELEEDPLYRLGLEKCYARLKNLVGDLSAFTTPQMAGDIDLVREALGYEKINFYGVSYGTHIGQYLMALYPETLRSVILDGVAPIPFDYINEIVFSHDRVLQAFFDACGRDPDCAEAYPDLETRVLAFLENLDEQPITMNYKDPYSILHFKEDLDGYEFLNMLLGLFYYDRTYATLPYLISQAESGNVKYFERMGSYSYFDWSFADGVYFSVLCAEHDPFGINEERTGHARPWLMEYQGNDWTRYSEVCDIWRVDAPVSRLDDLVENEIPALLLSGQFDPITPPDYAGEVEKGLSQSFYVIDPQGGHGVAFSDDCTESILNSFIYNPSREPRTSCLGKEDRSAELVPPDAIQLKYLVSGMHKGYYLEAGITIYSILLGLILLVLAFTFIGSLLRRIRRKKVFYLDSENILKKLHIVLILGFIVIALTYCICMTDIIFETRQSLSYAYVFAVPAEAKNVLLLPLVMLALSIEILIVGRKLCRCAVLRRLEKNNFSLFCIIMISTMGFLLHAGLVIWPL